MNKREKQAFDRGYLIACCNISNMHGEESIACDVLAEAGITQDDIDGMGLCEYDADALSQIRKARGTDPILKAKP